MHARLLILIALTVLGACSTDSQLPPADTIYFGGEILTVEGSAPEYVEAIGITDGVITQLGDVSDIETYQGENTQVIDLEGKTLLPGFFDSHSHLASVGMKLATVNLDSKPAGDITSIDDIVSQLKARLANNPPPEGEWLLGMGYDNAMLAEDRHPTKADLDKVSTEIPIVIIHFSMHMAVLNSKALELENITAASVDPDGGVIQRVENSNEPNGILEETAMRGPLLKTIAALGDGSRYGSKTFIERGLEVYAKNGFTTVIEGAATPVQIML
jgi:predicted amidohydrolase YtcJ